jgi:outer membrane protein TolC
MANNNIKSAEENLRCAQVGFREGVMETTDVLEAQTAWQQAQSQKIDAEIDVKMAKVNLEKAMGILSQNSH